MEVEIIFSGLCAFNNVRDINPTMGEPSVILIRTDDENVPEVLPEGTATPILKFESSTSTPCTPFYSAKVNQVANDRWGRTRKDISAPVPESTSTEGTSRAVPDVHIPHISFDSSEVRVNEEAES